MSSYDCVMKRMGNYVKVKRYGKKVRREENPRKTKAQRKEEMKEIESNPELSELEKLIQTAILEDSGKKDEEDRKPTKRIVRPRKLTLNEIERFCDLMDMNFTVGDKVLTLTFEKDDVPLDEASHDFENWIKRMRERYGGFKYLAVRSFQTRGTVHFHMLADLPRIPKEELVSGAFRDLWGKGNVDIKRIYNSQIVDRRAKLKQYLLRNLREFKADDRSFGKRLYLPSNNLLKPEIIKGDYEELMEMMKDSGHMLKKLDAYQFPVEYLDFIEMQTYEIQELAENRKDSSSVIPNL